jgi:hypothetical protein
LINGTITQERANEHYAHLDASGHHVLDLGCGRWGITDLDETTPGYFHKSGAKSITGVDRSGGDVLFYRRTLPGDFHHLNITTADEVRTLLPNVTLLKVDIEGAERHLLELSADDLGGIQVMAIEYHDGEIRQALITWAEDRGFQATRDCRFTYGQGIKGVLYFHR